MTLKPATPPPLSGARTTRAVGPLITAEGLTHVDLLLGDTKLASRQYGIIGETHDGRVIAVDWNYCHCWSIVGTPGMGKSNMCQVAIESAALARKPLQSLVKPLAVMVFHYGDEELRPEYVAMSTPNDNVAQAELLKRRYGADPDACDDVTLLVPEIMLEKRRQEFSHLAIKVKPLLFHPAELTADHYRLMLGLAEKKGLLTRVVNNILRRARRTKTPVSLDYLVKSIEASRIPQIDKDEIIEAAETARSFIREDDERLQAEMKPGRIIIVDMRDPTIEAEEAFALMVVAFEILSGAMDGDKPMSKFAIFDEAHEYITPDAKVLAGKIISKTRTRRHRAMSIAVSSQDPVTFPPRILGLSDLITVFGTNTPSDLDVVRESCLPFAKVDPYEVSQLETGHAMFWAKKASEMLPYTKEPVRVKIRLPQSRPGGATITAVKDD